MLTYNDLPELFDKMLGTARYWYKDSDGNVVTMEWRPMTEEDKPLEPGEPEPVEEPDEPEDPDLEQPKTDPVEE